MKNKPTSLTEFLKYIDENNLSSVRLLNTLRMSDGSIYDRTSEVCIDDIRDITDKIFLSLRNVGVTMLAEFKELRTNYLDYISSKISETEDNTIPFIDRQKYTCWMRPDILKTLEAIEDETAFLESALLEKFERDGVELTKTIISENENTSNI